MNNSVSQRSVLVIGAGIVGLSVALRLQLDGYDVTIVDAQEPMKGCSAGNAGCLSEANIFPPMTPEMLLQVPKLLLSSDGPLVIRPSYVAQMMPWLGLAAKALRASERERIISAMASITSRAIASFDDLVAASGASDLLAAQGLLVAFKSATSLESRAQRLPVWKQYGIQVERLGASDTRDLAPALHEEMAGGLFFSRSGQCKEPYLLGIRYLERLKRGGGKLIRAKVISVARDSEGRAKVATTGGELSAGHIVVCAGYQSKALLQSLGQNVPLASERGYHLMLPNAGIGLNLPVIFGEPYFAATPMLNGIRLAGTAEFARFDAPANLGRARMLYRQARSYLPGISDANAYSWLGVRPTFPDGMPAIGVVDDCPEVLYAFGHSHNGLTLSAITAKCIAALMSGEAIDIPIHEMSLRRFQKA
jgi:D-amino-acid dehydrogenase